jgi:hypothetical protein
MSLPRDEDLPQDVRDTRVRLTLLPKATHARLVPKVRNREEVSSWLCGDKAEQPVAANFKSGARRSRGASYSRAGRRLRG